MQTKATWPRPFAALLGLSAGLAVLVAGCATDTGTSTSALSTSTQAQLDIEASRALQQLYAMSPAARNLASQAKAILVFPGVVKGGFMIGGELGNGVLRENGRTTGYYNISAASYGFQAGIQDFDYALFFMTDSALEYLRRSGGWELGTGPSLVVLQEGSARTISTTAAQKDIYAFIYGQTGLMGGMGLQGSKITRLGSSPP